MQFKSHQELFDGAVKHQFEQKKAGLLPRGGGAYRGHGGYTCCIGALIHMDYYKTCMEGIPIRHLVADPETLPIYMDNGIEALREALLAANVNIHDEETVALLSALLNVNDVFGTWEWKDRFGSIAKTFKLNTEALKPY